MSTNGNCLDLIDAVINELGELGLSDEIQDNMLVIRRKFLDELKES